VAVVAAHGRGNHLFAEHPDQEKFPLDHELARDVLDGIVPGAK